METPEVLHRVVVDLQQAKHDAKSNDAATQQDKALAQMITAENHAKAVDKFLVLSDGERQFSATMASFGLERAAEEAQRRADEYFAIAQRHIKASEECQKKGEELAAGNGQPAAQQPQRSRRPVPTPPPPPHPGDDC